MATPFDRLIPRTLVERVLAVLVALLLVGLLSNALRTTYFWVDEGTHRVCMQSSFVGSYPAGDASGCAAADAADDARMLRRAHDQELRRLERPTR